MSLRPLTKGLIIGGIMLLVFYLFILGTFYVVSDEGISIHGASVGVVEINGAISESKSILENIIEFRDNPKIRAILLRIDSPGGAVGPTQEVYREVLRTIEIKPVVVSMGGTCASGGYYIAAAASRIVANPGTLTGSIGVVMEFLNVEGLFEWVGLKSRVIKSGEYKDIGNYDRKMTPKEEKLLQDVVDNVHEQFVQAISRGRNIPAEEVAMLADGRIFTGEQAKALNLVDELGNFQDAVLVAAQLAGIEGKPEIYWPKKRKSNYLDLFLEEFSTRFVNSVLDKIPGNDTSIMYK